MVALRLSKEKARSIRWRGRALLFVALAAASGLVLFGGPQLASASGTVSAPVALASSQCGNAASTTHVCTATVTASVPVGATVFIAAAETNTPSSGSFSATDSAGNTYARDRTQGTNAQVALFSAPVTTALTNGSSTITVTFPGTGSDSLSHVFTAFYVTGLRTSSALDQTGSSSGSVNAVSVTSGSTVQAAEFVVAAWGEASNKTMTPTSPCGGPTTPVTSSNNVGVGYFDKSVSSTGAQTCAGAFASGNPNWGAVIGTYKIDVTNPNAPAITFPSASFYGPSTWTTIAGTASDDAGGSGIASDSVQIKDNTNSTYWNGTTWQAGATSVAATGTPTSWTYALASANLTDTHNYTVSVTSTDYATNVSPATTKSFTYDSTPPAYASSATNTLGTQVTLTYTEAGSGLNTGITPATSAFTVTGCSASCSVTNVSVASSTTVVLTLASRIYGGASPTVAYTQPGTNKLQDNAGNLAANLSAQSVTNTATASLTQSTISASPGSITNDGSTSSTITVQLKNSAGTNLSSSGGTVTVSTDLGTFPSSCSSNCATTDNGNGTYTATLTSTTVGTATISAKLDGSALTNTTTVTVNPATCTSCTWTGAGGDNNWTTAANWQGTRLPDTSGTTILTFPSGASRLSNNNNEPAGTTFLGINISGSGYTLAGNQVTLGSTGIHDSTTSGASTISLPLTTTAVRTIGVTNAAETLTLSGVYSGTGGISKSGGGVLALSGTNTYSGSTTISAGTITANASAALGDGSATNTFVFSNGILQASGTITSPSTRTVTLSAGGTIDTNGNNVSIAGVISGAGSSLTKNGSGALTLSAANTFTGGFTLNAGEVDVNSAQALGTSAGTFTIAGGTIDNTSGGPITTVNYPQAWNGDFTFTGSNALNLGTGNVTLGASRQVTASASTLTVGGVISGSFGLTKSGGGTLADLGNNTYTGSTTISAGTLNANTTGSLGNSSATNTLVFNGGTLQASGTITSNGTRTVSLTGAGTVDTNGNTVSIAGPISGTNGLTKTGSGALQLSGPNTFQGGVALNSGELDINSAGALGTGTLTIAGGTTIDNTTGGAITNANNNTQAWNGDFTFGGTKSLNLGTGAVTLSGSRQVTVTGATGALTVGGVISGSGFSLTKAGAGELALSGANTFTGGTTLNAGILDINNAQALGTAAGTFTIAGGTINSTSAGAITTVNYPQAWNSDFTFVGTKDLNLGTGPVTLGASRQVSVTGSTSTLTVGGAISGPGFSITKGGPGALALGGANTFSGGVTLSNGQLDINSAAALGTGTFTVAGGTTIDNTSGGVVTESNNNAQAWSGNFTFGGTNDLNLGTGAVTLSGNPQATVSGGTLTVGGPIGGGAQSLTKLGGGALTLAGANTFSGGLSLSAGTLNINSATALGTGTFTVAGGTTIDNTSGGAVTESNNNAQAWNGNFTFAGTNDLNLGTGAVSAARTVTVTAGTLTVGGAIPGGNLGKAGSGTLALTGTSSYSGTTTISAGTLKASSSAAIGNGSGTNTLIFSGGTLQAGGTITSPGSRTVTLSAPAPATIDTNGTGVSIAGVISGPGIGLTKSGSGTLTLSGSNTYTGVTTVNAGTLTVNGSQSGSAVSLNGGTLSGTGTTGAVTSTAGGGTVAPGTASPGTLSTGNVNLSSGSPTFSVQLNGTVAGSTYSQLNVTGTVNLTGATLIGSLGYTPVYNDQYTIVNNDGADAVTGTFAGLPNGSSLTIGGKSFRILYNGGTGNDVVLIAGGATKLAVTSVPANATANVNFSVTVQSQDASGSCVQVNSNTAISLASDGAGTLSGNTATITAGTCSVTLNSVQDDQGETIHLTASRTSGDGLAASAASSAIVVANGTFTTNTAVSINGTPKVGTATTLTAGSYSPAHTGTSYQWQLCDNTGAGCSNISGATNSTYTPVAGDVGSTLRVVETITRAGYNNGGSTSAASPVVVNGDFTTNTAVAINGTPKVDVSTTLTAGSYTPTPTGSSYQWRLCDNTGGSCADIGGATSSTYTPVAGDVGHTLRVVETVSASGYNNGGSTSAASPVVVKNDFTTNTAVAINGTPTVDTASTLTAGSYTPSPTSSAYQWELCDSSGNNCSNIGGATSSSYTPVAGDVGSTLRVVETVSKSGYNDGSSTSAASPAVVKASFSTNTAVSVSGTPTVGTAFASIAGSYSPTQTSTAYQWELCDGSGNNCSNIGGATSTSYTPVAGDVGSTLRVVETVSKSGYNDGGSTSSASAVVVKGSFTTNTAVSVSGTPTVGTSFASTAGSYSPTPVSVAYQWELCDSSGNNCSNISGATSSSYKPVAGDVGSTLRIVETVSKSGYNDGGSTSSASAVVIKGSFVMTSAVTINGQPAVGTAVTITNGVYSPTVTSRADQWQLCDSSGNNCSNIGGATTNKYTPVPGDIGSTLRVIETVSRAGYNDGTSTSSASPAVIKGTFTTTAAVAINGTPTVDAASTITVGTYSPTPASRAYQWELCDSAGNNCSNIGGATSTSYTPDSSEVGSTLRVVETVSKNGYNDRSSTSARATVVVGPITTNTAVAMNGSPAVGVATTVTAGSYTPTPTSSSYQWKSCDGSGNNCSNIAGATSNTYTPVAGDVGHTLRVVETASKFGYSDGSSTSAASPVVVNGSFSTTTGVAINGTPTVGTGTTVSAGSYTPAPASGSYQWELCDSFGNGCSNIGGATSSSYTPVAGDVGSTLRVVETVSKAGYNNGSSTSSASAVVIQGSFTTTTAVMINGQPKVGAAATITTGVYSPAPTSSSYQWELCDSGGANCSNIGGATSNTYTPDSSQVGSTLRVVETPTRAGYNNGSSTSSAAVVDGVFATNTAVAINGTPAVGAKSTITAGSYTPSPTGLSYHWRRCDSSGNNCVSISGATYPTYKPVAADVGKTLRVVETVTKSFYVTASSTSAASAVVAKGTFKMNTQVAVFGYPKKGVVSKITQGSYTPTPSTRKYQWLRCTGTDRASCVTITGATAKSYTPVAADVGKRLRVVETVSAAGYNSLSVASLASAIATS